MKTLIFHADDLGLNNSFNAGIFEAYLQGMLTSTCIRVNGGAYQEAVHEILPQCPGLGVGLHLNIVNGKSRLADFKNSYLCDSSGEYNRSFIELWINSRKQKVLSEIEREYRNQIETYLKVGNIDHLNSEEHSHSIPAIFDLVCKLAKEYNISYVRLPREEVYFCSKPYKQLELLVETPSNLIKVFLMNYFAPANKRSAERYGVKTNDAFIGILYTGIMDQNTIIDGLKKCKNYEVVEVLIHPCKLLGLKSEVYFSGLRQYVINPHRRYELRAAKSKELYDGILQLGFELNNYSNLVTGKSMNKKFFCDHNGSQQGPKEPRLRTRLVLDETPFFQPEYTNFLINDCEHIEVVSVDRIVLPKGDILEDYLLKNWKLLGIKELIWLGFKSVWLRILGMISKKVDGRYFLSVKDVCERSQVSFRTIERIDTKQYVDLIKQDKIDLIISSNTLIFKEEILNAPRVAAINRHSSLLPFGGGIFPAFRAIQFKSDCYGVTVHKMVKEIDAGEVLSRKYFPRVENESMYQMYKLSFYLSGEATDEACQRLRFNNFVEMPDDRKLLKSYFSWPNKKDWSEFRKNGGKFI